MEWSGGVLAFSHLDQNVSRRGCDEDAEEFLQSRVFDCRCLKTGVENQHFQGQETLEIKKR